MSAATSAMQQGNFEQAVSICRSALQSDPANFRLWTLEGLAYSRSHHPDEALDAYGRALKLSPAYLPALEGSAEIEYKRDPKHAMGLLHQILAQRPADPTAHAMLAVLEYKSKDCAAAITDFSAAGVESSGNPLMLEQYGFCLAAEQRYADAAAQFGRIVATHPEANGARYNQALALWLGKHGGDALQTLQPLLSSGSADEATLSLAADICESEGDTPNAIQYLRQAIVKNPKDATNYLQFATLSYNHRSYQVGIDMLNVGLQQIPDSAELYLSRGILYSQLSNDDRAMTDFERAYKLDPSLASTTSAEGIMQSQRHDVAGAIDTFRKAAREHPKDAYTHYLLAEALSQQSYSPGSAGYTEEIAAAEKALALDPKLVQAHDLLGTLYLQAGNTGRVIEHCRAALAIDANDEQALYHLILALRKTNDASQIPALVKRLADVRQAAQSKNKSSKQYQLSIASEPQQQ